MDKTENYYRPYNQNEIINLLIPEYGDTPKQQTVFDEIKKGMSYMLSVEWLLRLLEDNRLSPNQVFPDTDKEPGTYSVSALIYYKQLADNYYKYIEDIKKTQRHHMFHLLEEYITNKEFIDTNKRYVELCSYSASTVSHGDYFVIRHYKLPDSVSNTDVAKITDALTNDTGLLLSLHICFNNAAFNYTHSMAVWQHENTYYFFDPNYGFYQLDNIMKLADIIKNHYANEHNEATHVTFLLSSVQKIK